MRNLIESEKDAEQNLIFIIMELKVRYESSPNIAWVKYWGKYHEDYILPINDSLGLTLNSNDLSTTT